ncbi:MAG: sugar-transfer associated ATP-grasp domain-containing protein [Kiritimatiellia bacterium]
MNKLVAEAETRARQLKQQALQCRVRRLSRRDWKDRFAKIYALNPAYGKRVDAQLELQHRRYWQGLRHDISLDTLRVCAAISGRADHRIVPEDVYVSEIERRLNDRSEVAFLQHKSVYQSWFGDAAGFPVVYLHKIDGVWYDANLKQIADEEVMPLLVSLPYPLVVKPNVDSFGGQGVVFAEKPTALMDALRGRRNLVVQERILPHPYFARLSPVGVNTFRVCLYRSVRTNQIHILNSALRMGKGGSLDNETAGGIVCYCDAHGLLHPYAVDKYGVKFESHPDAGIPFCKLERIPDYEGMRSLALKVAERIFPCRLMSLDLCLDATGCWRSIEINLFKQTIRFAQYAGYPFFGDFTDEVVEYCTQ